MRTFAIVITTIIGVLLLAASLMAAQGVIATPNQWGDALLMLAALLCFGMALMLACRVGETNVERNYRHLKRLQELDQHLWERAHNHKALRALERQ